MNEVLGIVGAVVITAGLAIGTAAVTKGWLLPGRGSAKILRPRVWGYGTLLNQAGTGAFLFLGPLDESRHPGFFPFAVAGMAVAALGLYVQRRAQFPADAGATRTSS
ncbi:hypothetical protein [Streptomyces sp. NPDC001536]|uniref:hypothetical protein n=1 Tax=Streptomyces sp. NPDC001536 TaxID=3364583 RepID=UPI0036D1D44A